MRFLDHQDVGQNLAEQLAVLAPSRPVVLAIPPGGVRIGWEIARRLGAQMDVILVNEVVVPRACRCRIGCAVDGHFYPNGSAPDFQALTEDYAAVLAASELMDQWRREQTLRHGLPPVDLTDCTAILVSDGSPDAEVLRGAVTAIRERCAAEIIYAGPVAPPSLARLMGSPARVVTMFRPEEYRSVMLVNSGYQQTTDDEISELISQSRCGEPWVQTT